MDTNIGDKNLRISKKIIDHSDGIRRVLRDNEEIDEGQRLGYYQTGIPVRENHMPPFSTQKNASQVQNGSFRTFDRDGNGVISTEEFKYSMVSGRKGEMDCNCN